MHMRDKEGKFYVAFMYRIDNNKLRAYPTSYQQTKITIKQPINGLMTQL